MSKKRKPPAGGREAENREASLTMTCGNSEMVQTKDGIRIQVRYTSHPDSLSGDGSNRRQSGRASAESSG